MGLKRALAAVCLASTSLVVAGCSDDDDDDGPPDSAGPTPRSPVTAADTIVTDG